MLTDSDFEKWYGCFPSDYPNTLNQALVDEGNDTALIVAGGIGYLIDIKNKILKYKTEEHPLIVSTIRTNSPDYFIAGTFYSVYVFDSRSLIKEINPDFIVDGIYFKSQIGNKAIGELATAENQYDYNMDFEFDLKTFDLKLNKKIIRKDHKLFEAVSVVDKDWTEKPNLIKRLIDKWKNK